MLTGVSSRRSTFIRSIPFTVTMSPLTDGKLFTDARARYRPATGHPPDTAHSPDRVLIRGWRAERRLAEGDERAFNRTLLCIENTTLDRHASVDEHVELS